MDSGISLTIFIVSISVTLVDPTVLKCVYKGVRILKLFVNITKGRTLLGRKIGIYEGQKSKCLLVLRLLCKGVKCVCTKEDIVADRAAVNRIETTICIPVSIILGSKLDTAYDAKRISCCRIYSLGLVDPVKRQLKCVGFFVELSLAQYEVVVHDLQFAVIHVKSGIEAKYRSNLGQNADTLCKLKKEVPCGSVLHISSGKHVNKIGKLSGNRDLSHIHCEDIGCNHILICINNQIVDKILCSSVRYYTVPGKKSITTRSLIKVEGVFTLLIEVYSDASANLGVSCGRCSYLNNLDTGCLVSNEGITVNNTSRLVVHSKNCVVFIDSYLLALIHSSNRKINSRSVYSTHCSLLEVYCIGDNNVHGLRTNRLITEHKIYFNGTVSETCEYAVLRNSCPSCIRNSPCVSLGKLSLVTGCADTYGIKLNGCANGRVVVIALNNCMIECSGAGSGRYDHKRCTYRTCNTVGGAVNNAESIITGKLRNEGSRSTTVKVDCVNASCLKHDLSDLLHATTAGEGLLTTVKYHEYDLTGSGNTNRRS